MVAIKSPLAGAEGLWEAFVCCDRDSDVGRVRSVADRDAALGVLLVSAGVFVLCIFALLGWL